MTTAFSGPLRAISPHDLRCFDDLDPAQPIRVDLAYGRADHPDNIFKTALYRPGAKAWCHRDLFEITCLAAQLCYQRHGYLFEIKDCLRPYEAQAKMQHCPIVKANPQWCEGPDRLLSRPGQGGHPRAMAIDIVLIDAAGTALDMGTPFDYFTDDPACNPAARAYRGFSPEIYAHRHYLESAMLEAAKQLDHPLLALPQEWWDFRFPPDYSAGFAPLYDADLPESMKMVLFD